MRDSHKSLSDTELFEMLKEGDTRAFDTIYSRYFIPLMNTAYKRLKSKEDAQEVVQDVFIQLYKKREIIEHTSNLSAYLYTLLRNRIIDRFREQINLQKQYNKLIKAQPASIQEAAHSSIDTKLLEEKINAAIDCLPDKCREVFLMSRKDQLSNKNIAKELEISVSTVEKHIIKALKFMREKVEKHHLNSAIIAWNIITTGFSHIHIDQHHFKCMIPIS